MWKYEICSSGVSSTKSPSRRKTVLNPDQELPQIPEENVSESGSSGGNKELQIDLHQLDSKETKKKPKK